MNGKNKDIHYRELWLIFRDGRNWISPWLKPGFGHVYMVMRDEFNWVAITPSEKFLEFKILPYSVGADVPYVINKYENHTVVHIQTNTELDKCRGLSLMRIFTCVTLIKYFSGIYCRGFTPWQLYKRLEKMHKSGKYGHGVQKIHQILGANHE